ncbi:MAG: hypothetical protein GY729_11580, partial [Desulfobacteraceae bacterium]|nr:hypothetical protein [Desulfobacteraceae bacterium]
MEQFKTYLDAISNANGLQVKNNSGWLFYPGMLFGSSQKWWDDFGTRTSCHEGIDILFYQTFSNQIQHLDETTKIPAMEDGSILNICDDLIAQTIVIQSPLNISSAYKTVMVYSHIIIFFF